MEHLVLLGEDLLARLPEAAADVLVDGLQVPRAEGSGALEIGPTASSTAAHAVSWSLFARANVAESGNILLVTDYCLSSNSGNN